MNTCPAYSVVQLQWLFLCISMESLQTSLSGRIQMSVCTSKTLCPSRTESRLPRGCGAASQDLISGAGETADAAGEPAPSKAQLRGAAGRLQLETKVRTQLLSRMKNIQCFPFSDTFYASVATGQCCFLSNFHQDQHALIDCTLDPKMNENTAETIPARGKSKAREHTPHSYVS